MALHRVWIATASDGLVRADRVIGIGSHETPRIAGKTPHWLLVVNLEVTAGSGDRAGWDVGILDRTLCQSGHPQDEAPVELAQLLARLDQADAAGVVTARTGRDTGGRVTFTFTPFPRPAAPAGGPTGGPATGPTHRPAEPGEYL